jgi:hypothetical protein
VPAAGGTDTLRALVQLANRFDGELPAYASGVYRQLAADDYPGTLPATSYADIPATGLLGAFGGAATGANIIAPDVSPADASGHVVYIAPSLYDSTDVDHAPAMQFLRDTAWITVARSDAERIGLQRSDRVRATIAGVSFDANVAVSRRLSPGVARIQAGTPGVPAGIRGWHALELTGVAATAAAGQGVGA